jgi:hypothetical protein
MDKKESFIISAYEKLRNAINEQTIRDTDQIWEDFLKTVSNWPKERKAILASSFSSQMEKIAATGAGGKIARKNFETFLTDVSNVNPRNEYQNIESIFTTDHHKFYKDIEEHSIEAILYLCIKYSKLSQTEAFEKLPYIDVLFTVLWNRMLNYPNYLHIQRPKALTKRFVNSIFQQSFTTIIDENKLHEVAVKLGISSETSYVTQQMHIRKMVNECLDIYNPKESSCFVKAAVAWWI